LIVVDTNVIAYLCIPGQLSQQAETVFLKDPEWAAPLLWRSEFANVLAGYLRKGHLDKATALSAANRAQEVLHGREFSAGIEAVLNLTSLSTCSAYNCEFVALAQDLRIPLVTTDGQILRDFPKIGVHPSDFIK
jgi:predicted nucleic acid-binding protein